MTVRLNSFAITTSFFHISYSSMQSYEKQRMLISEPVVYLMLTYDRYGHAVDHIVHCFLWHDIKKFKAFKRLMCISRKYKSLASYSMVHHSKVLHVKGNLADIISTVLSMPRFNFYRSRRLRGCQLFGTKFSCERYFPAKRAALSLLK